MGLDMYLYASKFTSDAEWVRDEERELFKKVVSAAGVSEFAHKDLPTVNLDLKVGYWRKANQVHQWFVDNVQDGIDNCAEYYVSREKLQELRDLCAQVLASKNAEVAEEMLPTATGFFFGSVEIDEWYWQDVQDTIDIIDRCMEMPQGWEFKYQSSW